MQAAAIVVLISPKTLDIQRLDLAGTCKKSLNFSFAQAFGGDKSTNAACAYESLLAMQPA
jgi:hypothetical protein